MSNAARDRLDYKFADSSGNNCLAKPTKAEHNNIIHIALMLQGNGDDTKQIGNNDGYRTNHNP